MGSGGPIINILGQARKTEDMSMNQKDNVQGASAAARAHTAAKLSKLGRSLGACEDVGVAEMPSGRPLLAKMGFDPTAPDLHLGHAVGLFALRRFQDMGHSVVLVVGDFTAAIGDPTGRNDTRPQLTAQAIEVNAATYAEQALAILDPSKTRVAFNGSWLAPLGAAGMIALAAKTTVAQMLARDDFKKRFEEGAPIGAHELLYPLLQARDSVELRPDVEFGGTDQRFNLLMGRELMREAGLPPQACAMVPLLVGLDGTRKMSKSLGNHIGLTEASEEIFAKTMSASDATMVQWREALGAERTERAGDPMESKKALAAWIVERLRGAEAAARSRTVWEASRERGNWEDLAEERAMAPPPEGKPWASLLRDWGWETSAEQARQRIAQGALRLDGVKIDDPRARALPGVAGLLRYGARKAAKLVAPGAGAAAVKAPRV